MTKTIQSQTLVRDLKKEKFVAGSSGLMMAFLMAMAVLLLSGELKASDSTEVTSSETCSSQASGDTQVPMKLKVQKFNH